jgi:GT2 family glycosyltransferase
MTEAQMRDLAIVIVSYKTRGELEACLNSLYADTQLPDADIVVVDNASGDGAPDMVREKFPKVNLIANDFNGGYSVGNNQGIRATKSRHLLLLNPDTEVSPGAVAGMMNFLDRHPRVGFVGCRLLNTDGSIQQSHFQLKLPFTKRFENRPWYRTLARRVVGIHDPEPEINENGSFRVDIVKGACMMVRRDVFDQIGLFDEKSFLYADDIDVSIRARRMGWDAYILPELRVLHHGYVSTDQEVFITITSSRHSALYLYKKHYPRWIAAAWSFMIYMEIMFKWALSRIRILRGGTDSNATERYRAYRTLGREILRLHNG